MPAALATVVFLAGIAGLFYLDRDRDAESSPALWLPVIWIAIGASRMASQWIAGEPILESPDAYLEGSAFDRWLLSGLLVAAIVVLIARARYTAPWLRANTPIIVFFLYCALSALWSDYPFVAFKRWTKALGNITMVVLVLTEHDPIAAVKKVLARSAFLLIPLSMLFIKYYPELGRVYNRWTWMTITTGVAMDKNGLGALCVIFGLASLWRFIGATRDRSDPNRQQIRVAHGTVIAMAAWLLMKADSSTSLACFAIGTLILWLTLGVDRFRPVRVNAIAIALAAAAGVAWTFQDIYAYVVEQLGRNTTLTGRTDIWNELFRMIDHSLVGTGFESFWLGPRAEHLWNLYYFHPNQAHNGYIETYINLGWIGVALLAAVIVSGYRNIVKIERSDIGSLCFAFFAVTLIYNFTEAAFKVMHPVFIAFLFATSAWPPLPAERRDPVPDRDEHTADWAEDVPLPWAVGR